MADTRKADRERILDEIARCYMRAAFNELLAAQADTTNKSADRGLEFPAGAKGKTGGDDSASSTARAS